MNKYLRSGLGSGGGEPVDTRAFRCSEVSGHFIVSTCRMVLLLIVLLLPSLSLLGQNYYFKQISLKENLSQSTVRAVCMDYRGLLWIGTNYGLNRYDGYKLRQYHHQKEDIHSISSDNIFFIEEDSLRNLWIGTKTSLMRYDRENDRFLSLEGDLSQLSFRSCVALKGGIAFLRADRILIFRYDTQRFQTVLFRGTHNNLNMALQGVVLDDQTLLIGARWKGLFTCNIRNGEIKRCDFYKEDNVVSLCRDCDGNLWITSYGKGVGCYTPQGKLIRIYDTSNSSLNNDVILDMAVTRRNDLWIGTDGGGVNILHIDRQEFSRMEHRPEDSYSIPAGSVSKLYEDTQGNVWIGTVRGGLLGFKEIFMRSFSGSYPGSQYGLSEQTASCFHEAAGQIWIGTDGGGINRYDPQSSRFTHFPSTAHKKIYSLTDYSADELLVSFYREGLYVFNKWNGNLREFPLPEYIRERIKTGWMGSTVKKISDTEIILLNDSVYRFSIPEKKLENLTVQAGGLHGNLKLRTGNESELLIFGEKAIFRYDIHSRAITAVHRLFGARDIVISSISADSQGNTWIGTDQGLFLLKKGAQEATRIETSLFNYITCVIADNEDNLWIGASGKLFRYVTRENRFVIYDESDGVAHNEYIDKSCLKTSGGEIYMGGITGFVLINAVIPPETPYIPTIEVEEILYNGRPLKYSEYAKERKIKLSPGNTSLGIRLMVKGKYLFNKPPIRYRLTGLNDELITTSDPMVHFLNLPPGEYRFMAESAQNNGEWTQPANVLTIQVLPYWWSSWWFYLLAVVFIITILSSFFIYYKRKKMQEMDQQKVRFLININHELRTPLTLISAPISRLLKKKDFTAAEAHTVLASVNKQAKQMKQVIDMVLDVRKMEVTSEKLQLSLHNFNRWIEETLSDFQSEFEANGIQLKFEPGESIGEVCFDINKCSIALNNLLINALKYSEPNTTVCLRSSLSGNKVRVSVSDQGIGLGNVDLDKLFTRFYQAPQQKGGTGIGLSYTKTLIELHQGQMGAYENPDKGATFYFEIPLSQAGKPVPPTIERMYGEVDLVEEGQTSAPDADFHFFRPYSVLIVEDQLELNKFLDDTFREYFDRVFCAFNGKEGLEICRQQQPDIIVSDVLMPEMNGLDLCRNVKEDIQTSHIPVVLLTARNSDENTLSGYRSGADAYLTKPFEVDALLSLIRNILSTRKVWTERFRSEGWSAMADPGITFARADQEFLSKLQGVVRNELGNPGLDVDLLADRMAVSRSTLYLKMKNLTGMGVKDFINELRIKTAMRYLLESDMQITEISDRTGFSQQRYFSTVFKQATGLTPSQYREKNRKP